MADAEGGEAGGQYMSDFDMVQRAKCLITNLVSCCGDK